MTRKQFAAIAHAFANVRPAQGTSAYAQWLRDVAAMASVLAVANPAFDPVRFGHACTAERTPSSERHAMAS